MLGQTSRKTAVSAAWYSLQEGQRANEDGEQVTLEGAARRSIAVRNGRELFVIGCACLQQAHANFPEGSLLNVRAAWRLGILAINTHGQRCSTLEVFTSASKVLINIHDNIRKAWRLLLGARPRMPVAVREFLRIRVFYLHT